MFSATSTMILLTSICFCLGCIAYNAYNKIQEDIYIPQKFALLPFATIATCSLLFVCLYFDNFHDFVYTPNTKYFIYPIFGGILLYASTYISKLRTYNFCIILAVTLCLTLLAPHDIIIYSPKIPYWFNPLITAILWSVFAYTWQYLNGIDGIMLISAMFFCIGTMFILWLGGSPALMGYQAASILGSLGSIFVYNKYPAKIKLSSTDCTFIGFLIGSIFIESIPEKNWPCLITFSLIPIGEFVYALFISLLNLKISNIITRTAYYQANITGLSTYMIYRQYLRLGTILLIFGCLELYAPNNYSSPSFAGILTLWYLFKLQNWANSEKTLKEINQDVLQELKNGLQKIKDSNNKD